MANPAWVQDYGLVRSGGSNVQTISCPMTTGNIQILGVSWYHNNSDTCTVTDTTDTWTEVPGTYQHFASGGGGLGFSSCVFYKISTVTATKTVTVTAPTGGGSSYTQVGGAEFSNPYIGGSPIGAVSSANSNTAAVPNSGNITTTFSNPILFGYIYNDNTNITNSGSGWTKIGSILFNAYLDEYRLPSSTGTFAATATTSVGAYTAAVVEFFGADYVPPSPTSSQPVVILFGL